MNLAVLTLLAQEHGGGTELPIPAYWYGILMFVLLMCGLFITLGFANKGRALPAEAHADH